MYARPMKGWTKAEVLAASRALDEAWLPAGIEAVRTEDYLLLCRPAHLTSPGSSRVQASIKSPRPFCEIRPEVERRARAWGAEEVLWRAEGDIGPAANESLRCAGASLALTERVMARSLDGSDADAWLAGGNPPGVATNFVTDEETFDALVTVETTGWGWPPRPADVLAEDWTNLRADLESSSKFALVATVNGTPASVARCVVNDSIVRLFGAVTLPAFHRRGLYRSLLAARCRLGRANGATLALTKGNLKTSAPILERIGFRSYAVEQCWRLGLDDT